MTNLIAQLTIQAILHTNLPPHFEMYCDDEGTFSPIIIHADNTTAHFANNFVFTNRQDAIERAWRGLDAWKIESLPLTKTYSDYNFKPCSVITNDCCGGFLFITNEIEFNIPTNEFVFIEQVGVNCISNLVVDQQYQGTIQIGTNFYTIKQIERR